MPQGGARGQNVGYFLDLFLLFWGEGAFYILWLHSELTKVLFRIDFIHFFIQTLRFNARVGSGAMGGGG